MGMNTYIVGFKPADEKYQRMHKVLEACRAAKVSPPDEVKAFFGRNWDEPSETDPLGVQVRLQNGHPGVRDWGAEMQEGFEADLRELDPDIKILRFINSY